MEVFFFFPPDPYNLSYIILLCSLNGIVSPQFNFPFRIVTFLQCFFTSRWVVYLLTNICIFKSVIFCSLTSWGREKGKVNGNEERHPHIPPTHKVLCSFLWLVMCSHKKRHKRGSGKQSLLYSWAQGGVACRIGQHVTAPILVRRSYGGTQAMAFIEFPGKGNAGQGNQDQGYVV